MIAELGHYALMLALGLALLQGTMPIVGARSNATGRPFLAEAQPDPYARSGQDFME